MSFRDIDDIIIYNHKAKKNNTYMETHGRRKAETHMAKTVLIGQVHSTLPVKGHSIFKG